MRNASSSSISSISKRRCRSDSCNSNSSSNSVNTNMSPKLPKNFRKFSETSLGSCDVVKVGYLHMKRPPTSGSVKLRLKTWQKRFFILRDESFEKGSAHLEIYVDSLWRKDRASMSECSFVDLESVSHVDEYSDSKNHPYALTMTRTGHAPLVLAADCQTDLMEWIVAIEVLADKLQSNNSCSRSGSPTDVSDNTKHGGGSKRTNNGGGGGITNRRPSAPSRITHWSSVGQLTVSELTLSTSNELKRKSSPKSDAKEEHHKNNIRILKLPSKPPASGYLVTVMDTDDSERHRLSGDYNLLPLREEILLQRPGRAGAAIAWPTKHIIKLKSEEDSNSSHIVTLETRQNCGASSGIYIFRTFLGRQIIAKVSEIRFESKGSHDEELERLRANAIAMCRAPSSPDLFNRCSPPKPCPRRASETRPPSEHNKKHGQLTLSDGPRCEAEPAEPLDQTDVNTDPLDIPIFLTDNGLRIDVPPPLPDNRPPHSPPPALPSRDRKTSNISVKLRPSPFPPSASVDDLNTQETWEVDRRLSLEETFIVKLKPTPMPRTSPNRSKRILSKLPPLPPGALDRTSPIRNSTDDIPPSLPPRGPSCSPPRPPPRPQHTLGINSSPVPLFF